MKVVVDTSVWSLALRRKKPERTRPVEELRSLIADGAVVLLGVVRQEVLSGIRHLDQFRLLRERLAAFPDPEIALGDYEFAAELCNECLRQRIQASHTDFLIAAVAVNRKWAVFSHDRDFEHLAKVVPVRIHQVRGKGGHCPPRRTVSVRESGHS